MGKMTLEEARKILGLKNGFTEKDLKVAYRKAARKCHPDIGGNNEDFQKVNEANEVLKNNLNTNMSVNCNSFDVTYYASVIARKIYNYVDIDIFSIDSTMINVWIYKIVNSKSKEEINKLYKLFLSYIVDKYHEYEGSFRKNWKIPDDFKYTIDYNCCTSDFVNQLEKVKNDYYNYLKNILRNELSKYSNWAGYDKMIGVIDEVCNKYVVKISKGYFSSKEHLINEINKEVRELFDSYFKLESDRPKLDKNVSETIRNIIMGLNSVYLMDFYDELLKESNINFFKLKSMLIDDVCFIKDKGYIKYFIDCLKAYSNVPLNLQRLLTNKIYILIHYLGLGMIDIDSIMNIRNLTLNDFENDINLINYILNNVGDDFKDFNYNYIYIDRHIDKRRSFEIPFEIMTYESETFYMNYLTRNGDVNPYKAIKKSFLDENYMSLREFLCCADFVGKIGMDKQSFDYVNVLYKLGELCLIIKNGQFDIVNEDKVLLLNRDEALEKYKKCQVVLKEVKGYLCDIVREKGFSYKKTGF